MDTTERFKTEFTRPIITDEVIIVGDEDMHVESYGVDTHPFEERGDDHIQVSILGRRKGNKGPANMVCFEGAGIDGTLEVSLEFLYRLLERTDLIDSDGRITP